MQQITCSGKTITFHEERNKEGELINKRFAQDYDSINKAKRELRAFQAQGHKYRSTQP